MSDIREAFEKVQRQFTSTNSIDVERATILRSDWELAKQHMEDRAQAVPEGFVMAPVRLTAENGAKTALSGEFHEVVELECTACDRDDEECEACSGSGSYTYRVPISWTTIKGIYSTAISQLAVPQPPQEGSGDE